MRVLLLICDVLVCLILLQLTGAAFIIKPWNYYNPTIPEEGYVLGTNLLSPKRLDYVLYNPFRGINEFEFCAARLCGMPGDTIIIDRGVVFVNGENIDESLNLRKLYLAGNRDTKSFGLTLSGDQLRIRCQDSVPVILETKFIKRNKLSVKPLTYFELQHDCGTPLSMFRYKYGRPWTPDNFGPYIVPADHYFVLGDNRVVNFEGPVPIKDVLGVIPGR